MVHTDAYGRVVFAAYIEKRHKACINLLYLFGVFFVGIFQLLEGSSWVYIVAGIYAYLLCIQRGHIGYVGVEMHVGHKWRVVTFLSECRIDVAQVLGLALSLGGKSHQLAASLYNTLGLGCASLGVVGVGGGHRLHAHGVVSTHRHAANGCYRCVSALQVKEVDADVTPFAIFL